MKYDKRGLTEQSYFLEWCQGLPSVLDTCYFYNRPARYDLLQVRGYYTRYADDDLTERVAEKQLTRTIYTTLLSGEMEYELTKE